MSPRRRGPRAPALDPGSAFLDRLRALRVRAGLTQHDVARRLGRPNARWVYLRERGRRGIDVDDFAAWVKVLGLGGDEIVELLARACAPAVAA